MLDKILLIGGSEAQCHAVDILKKMNKYVIVADYEPDCMGAKMADLFIHVSTADVKELSRVALEQNVEAVIAVQSDLGMVTASKISSELGLNGLLPNIAELFTNKYEMRRFLKEHNFLYPSFKLCFDEEDVKSFAGEYGLPFVMKPIDSQGSRGINIITSDKDFGKIADSIQYNRHAKGVIVEEYLGEDEYTVEGIVVGGHHYTLAISHKSHYDKIPYVSNELFYSWEYEYEDLICKHNSLIETTGLNMGLTHSEYMKTKQGFVLVEFAARGGGSMIASHIVPAICGWDVEEIYIREVLRKKIIIPPLTRNCAVLKFIELEEKVIKRISGLEKIRNFENVITIYLKYREGEKVPAVQNDTNRHGFYIAWAETKEKLVKLMNQIHNTLEVEYE